MIYSNLLALALKIFGFSTNCNLSPIQLHSIVEGNYEFIDHSPSCSYPFFYRCQQTMNVDRREYQTITIITCPLPGCSHTWCKECQQTIVPGGPEHSCDGLSEFTHLIQQQGWRRCPGEP